MTPASGTPFETRRLFDLVNDVDLLRSRLSDEGITPPELRTDLLRLHGLALRWTNTGSVADADEAFALASDVESEAWEILEAAARLYNIVTELTERLTAALDAADPAS